MTRAHVHSADCWCEPTCIKYREYTFWLHHFSPSDFDSEELDDLIHALEQDDDSGG